MLQPDGCTTFTSIMKVTPFSIGSNNIFENIHIILIGNVYTFGCNDEGALGRKIEDKDESFNFGK